MENTQAQQMGTYNISSDIAQRITQDLGENVYLCYQCVKCTSGCPVAEFFDWQPNQIMRALQLGQEDIALESQTPWLCASCQTCTTRCPQGIDITGIMEFLTREALARGYKPQVAEVNNFNIAFLREVGLWGRAYEPGLMAEMILHKPKSLTDDLDLYIAMLKKKKVAFLPSPSRPPHKVKPIPNAAEAVAYYPGCSLHSTAPEFNTSTKAICESLDLELIEPQGWVCCGSSAAHRSNPEIGLRLPMENLALIEKSGFKEVSMPCAACFNRHKASLFEIRNDQEQKAWVDEKLGYNYQDQVQVSTLAEMLFQHIGTEKLTDRVKQPLFGLRIVCYYGCLLTRPPEVTGATHPENPTDMDELMRALGTEVLDWSYKTTCCGAAHSLSRPDIVLQLSSGIIKHARQTGADVIVVACPLCHANLDARQIQMGLDEPMPVLYLTQLLAIALGLPEKEAALHKNIIDPRPVLHAKGIMETM